MDNSVYAWLRVQCACRFRIESLAYSHLCMQPYTAIHLRTYPCSCMHVYCIHPHKSAYRHVYGCVDGCIHKHTYWYIMLSIPEADKLQCKFNYPISFVVWACWYLLSTSVFTMNDCTSNHCFLEKGNYY